MYAACLSFLGAANAYHCVFDATQQRGVYDVCVLYSDALAEADGCDEQAYFDRLRERVNAQTGVPVLMFIGDRVGSLETLDSSVRSAIAARVVEKLPHGRPAGGQRKRRQALQTDAGRADPGGGAGRRRRDRAGCRRAVQCAGQRRAGRPDDHSQCQLPAVPARLPAVQQDENVNQEEILRYISANTYAEGALHGGAGISEPLRQRVRRATWPSCAAAMWGGVLAKIERECGKTTPRT